LRTFILDPFFLSDLFDKLIGNDLAPTREDRNSVSVGDLLGFLLIAGQAFADQSRNNLANRGFLETRQFPLRDKNVVVNVQRSSHVPDAVASPHQMSTRLFKTGDDLSEQVAPGNGAEGPTVGTLVRIVAGEMNAAVGLN